MLLGRVALARPACPSKVLQSDRSSGCLGKSAGHLLGTVAPLPTSFHGSQALVRAGELDGGSPLGQVQTSGHAVSRVVERLGIDDGEASHIVHVVDVAAPRLASVSGRRTGRKVQKTNRAVSQSNVFHPPAAFGVVHVGFLGCFCGLFQLLWKRPVFVREAHVVLIALGFVIVVVVDIVVVDVVGLIKGVVIVVIVVEDMVVRGSRPHSWTLSVTFCKGPWRSACGRHQTS